jgi:hypothetical protein
LQNSFSFLAIVALLPTIARPFCTSKDAIGRNRYLVPSDYQENKSSFGRIPAQKKIPIRKKTS